MKPLTPTVVARLLSISPNMMLKASAAPSGVRRQDSVTSQDDDSPISFSQRLPRLVDATSPAALRRPSMAK